MVRAVDEAALRSYVRLRSFLFSDRAQTLAEYGLILTVVAVGVTVPTMLFFRQQIAGAYNSTINCLVGSC